MKNPITEIKQKIKQVKIWVAILAIIFLALIINSICLTYKVYELEKQTYTKWEYSKQEKAPCNNGGCNKNHEVHECGNH